VSNEGWCEATLRALARVAEEHDLFGAAVTVHSADPPGRFQDLARQLDLPLLRGPRDAMRALAGVTGRRRWRPLTPDGDAPDVRDLLAPGPLPEHESALVLERYGVPFAPRRRAATPDDAARAASELGLPVVVKLDGPSHKSRAGGVVLGLDSPEAVAAEARRLGGSVLVARQLAAAHEAICGMSRDPDYGPVLVVGAGGVDVEDLGRASVSIAPIDLDGARELVVEADLPDPGDVLASTLVALSRLALAHPEIDAIDVNPFLLSPDGTVAVDALVLVTNATDSV
jgi:acyl-CoA synthetase (NDP forming)